MSKLKPCPFCGSNRILLAPSNPIDPSTDYAVICLDCKVSTRTDDEFSAERYWNMRRVTSKILEQRFDWVDEIMNLLQDDRYSSVQKRTEIKQLIQQREQKVRDEILSKFNRIPHMYSHGITQAFFCQIMNEIKEGK